MRSNKTICSGPTAHACNHCWWHKKSCSNGGSSYVLCFRSTKLTHRILYRSPRSGCGGQSRTKISRPVCAEEAQDTFNNRCQSHQPHGPNQCRLWPHPGERKATNDGRQWVCVRPVG